MEPSLRSTLERLTCGPAQYFRGLTVVPVMAPEVAPGPPTYLTLDRALGESFGRVGEVSAEGQVPELLFSNDGELPVLLLDGEEVVGAKQNRIVNLTILAPGRSSIVIPVSCVVNGGREPRISNAAGF